MNITILTQYYPPEHGAPQNRLHDLAKRWKGMGHNITILTAMPNYPNGVVFDDYKGKFSHTEEIDGIKVIRSAIFASKKKKTFIQLAVYFSFVFSSLLVGLSKLGRQDYLLCESPPLFLGFSAVVLSFFCRAKLIMNISDLWPESAVQLGLIGPGPALSILEAFERFLYKSSALVSCQTEGIVDGVKNSYPKANTFLFPNGVDLDMFPAVKEKDMELAKSLNIDTSKFIVGYGGNHGRSQALSQILRAAEMLKEMKADNIIFTFFGDGPEKDELEAYAKEQQLDNVFFFPSQARESMAAVQSLWDVAMVPLKNIDLFDGARPSKMFELMAGEIPFIFCGRGEGAEIAEKSGCAMVVTPEDSKALADKILELSKLSKEEIKAKGKNGRSFVTEHFNRAKLAEQFMNKLSNHE